MLKNKHAWFAISMIFGAAGFILWLIRWYMESTYDYSMLWPKPTYDYSVLWPIGANTIQLISLKIYLIMDKKDL